MNAANRRTRSGRALARRLCLVAAIVAVAAGAPMAHALPRVTRYVQVSASPANLDLGNVPHPGTYDSAAKLKVHVVANCVHGGIAASVTALARTGGGGSIGPERIFVKVPATGNYVAMKNPVPLTGPMNPGVFDVILKFRVKTELQDPVGTYTGTMTITYAPAP